MKNILAICMVVVLGGCSGGGSLGNLNPFNWFSGNSATSQTGENLSLAPRKGYATQIDSRPVVNQVNTLSIDRTAAGIIVRATAIASTQGYHSADLVMVPSVNANEITFQFRARPPAQPMQAGPVHLRELVVAQYLSTSQVSGIRRINVIAAQNSRSIRP